MVIILGVDCSFELLFRLLNILKSISHLSPIFFCAGVRADLVGYVFMAISVTYLSLSPVWGVAIQKGYVGYSLTFSFIAGQSDVR